MRNAVARKVHTWNKEADKRLLETVELYGLYNWQLGMYLVLTQKFQANEILEVAANVSEDATGAQCQKRFFDSIDPAIKAGAWSTDEEEKISRAVAAFDRSDESQPGTSTRKAKSGISWVDVALFLPGRTNNQCREHYESMTKGNHSIFVRR